MQIYFGFYFTASTHFGSYLGQHLSFPVSEVRLFHAFVIQSACFVTFCIPLWDSFNLVNDFLKNLHLLIFTLCTVNVYGF